MAQLDAVAVAGGQHGASLAHVVGHPFLAKDALGRVLRGRQDGHVHVERLGGGDVDEVGLFLAQHRFEVGVATLDVVGVGHPVEGDFVDIAERHQFGGVRMHVGVGVVAPHTATHHHCRQCLSGHAHGLSHL